MIPGQNSHCLFQSLVSGVDQWRMPYLKPEDTSLNSNLLSVRDAFHIRVMVFHEIESAKYFGEVAKPWANGLAVECCQWGQEMIILHKLSAPGNATAAVYVPDGGNKDK